MSSHQESEGAGKEWFRLAMGSCVGKKSQERNFWIEWKCHGPRLRAEKVES